MYRLQDKDNIKKSKAYNNFSNVRTIVDKPSADGLKIPPAARKRMELRMKTREEQRNESLPKLG